MTYLYKERCLNTVEELYQFFAADCPLVSNGYTVTCAPTSTGLISRLPIRLQPTLSPKQLYPLQ